MALLSNDVSEWSAFLTELHRIDPFFDTKIISGDTGCRKPKREIFEFALERLGRPASECLFVDNSVRNLQTAKEIGMRAVISIETQ